MYTDLGTCWQQCFSCSMQPEGVADDAEDRTFASHVECDFYIEACAKGAPTSTRVPLPPLPSKHHHTSPTTVAGLSSQRLSLTRF